MADETRVPSGVDVSVPNVARMYDYYLGGSNHFAADREVAEKVLSSFPELRTIARENRAFLGRVVRFLAGDEGIRQFVDVGAGLPTVENVHEVAGAVTPDARVVYADNDPVVGAHGRALLADTETAAIIQADLRHPEEILNHPETRRLIDFGEPVAVLLLAVLHFVPDGDDPYAVVARLGDAMAPGSYLVISHASSESMPPSVRAAADSYDRATAQMAFRSRAEIHRFFDGFDLLDPGLVDVDAWRNPVPPDRRERLEGLGYVGVGRKR